MFAKRSYAQNCRTNPPCVSLRLPLTLMISKPKTQRREHFKTSSGIELPVDFNPSNTETVEYNRDLGDPGEFPFTRGIRANMYRGRLWTMR